MTGKFTSWKCTFATSSKKKCKKMPRMGRGDKISYLEEILTNVWPLKIRDRFRSFDCPYSSILLTVTKRQKFFFFSSKKSGAFINTPSTVLALRNILVNLFDSAPMKRSICSMVIINTRYLLMPAPANITYVYI